MAEAKSRVITTKEVTVTLPVVKVPGWLQGFTDFVREQGVVGVAIGFVIGAQIKTLVDQLVASFINPLLGLVLPGKGNLAEKYFQVHWLGKKADFGYGAFLFQLISFFIVAAIVYILVRKLKLDRLDKKKD
jgi:large conductance mechanosensitive channel